MAEENKGSSCKKWVLHYLAIIILIIVGTGILAQWQAWNGYKLYHSDKFNIKIYFQDGQNIQVPAGREIKVSRASNRVEVFTPDRKTRDIYYNMTKIELGSK